MYPCPGSCSLILCGAPVGRWKARHQAPQIRPQWHLLDSQKLPGVPEGAMIVSPAHDLDLFGHTEMILPHLSPDLSRG